jgi:rhamnosyltransferase subunit B
MHALISTVGSAGDVHPFIAIGQALQRRGHAVELLTSPHFEARIRAAGLGFVPLGTAADYARIVQQPELWDARRSFGLIWREMLPRLREGHAAALARVQPGRTVLVGSTLAWHLRLLQETHALPAVTVHLSPLCLFSATAPARLPGTPDMTGWPPALVRALQAGVERFALDRVVTPGLNALRRDLGLPPVRRVMSHWANAPQRVIGAWPEWFAPRQPDWPAQAVTSGFARWTAAASAPLEPALRAFLDAGPPPIGFTPGSAMAHGRDFFARALAACAATGQRALLITPYADQLPSPLPPGAFAVAYAPFDALLPRLAALVHHGGIGTCAQALAAGLPQAVMPFAHDQFDNALRLQRLGCGLTLSRRSGAGAWHAALTRLTRDPALATAARQCAVRMAEDADAPERIAARIEAALSP